MGESIREQLIRQGIIKPGPSLQPLPPKAQPAIKATSVPVVSEPAKPKREQTGAAKTVVATRPTDHLKNFAGEMPGSDAWYAGIRALENHLIRMPINDFRSIVGHNAFGDVLNICEYVDRISLKEHESSGWLIKIARDFCDLSKNLRGRTYELSQAYEVATRRHKLALAAWNVARTQDRSAVTRDRVLEVHQRGSMSRRWIEEAWDDLSAMQQRKAEVRVAFATYASGRLRHELGIKTAKVEPVYSVWEAAGASRRFGGGRPRNERFKR